MKNVFFSKKSAFLMPDEGSDVETAAGDRPHIHLRIDAETVGLGLPDEAGEFVLRDDTGELYRGFSYISSVSGRYTFFRVVFDGVDLFRFGTADTRPGVPSEKSGYIYKGQNAAEEVESAVGFLYLDIYYSEDADTGGEPFCYPLMVYRSSLEFPKKGYELPEKPDEFTVFVPDEK